MACCRTRPSSQQMRLDLILASGRRSRLLGLNPCLLLQISSGSYSTSFCGSTALHSSDLGNNCP